MLSCRHFEMKVVEQCKENFVHPLNSLWVIHRRWPSRKTSAIQPLYCSLPIKHPNWTNTGRGHLVIHHLGLFAFTMSSKVTIQSEKCTRAVTKRNCVSGWFPRCIQQRLLVPYESSAVEPSTPIAVETMPSWSQTVQQLTILRIT